VRIQKGIKTRKNRMKGELRPECDLGQLLKGGYVASTRRATTRVQIWFSWTRMSARPFAVGGSVSRRTVPSAYIAAEPRRVGAPLVGALTEGRHEACPYIVIELRKVGSYKPA
jgi:hypothetical protein